MEVRPETIKYYADSRTEFTRLEKGHGLLEKARTQSIISRYLAEAPMKILDVGGATGAYALWLSNLGHEVHLIDPVPEHIDEASRLSRDSETPLASIRLGDARQLELADSSFDIVLELGPLYHLVERQDRIAALKEAGRVVKEGGLVFAAAISRFAPALDGFYRDMVKESVLEVMNNGLKTGQHRNPSGDRRYFVTAYLHHPEEMREEMDEAGLAFTSVLSVEGFGWLMPEFDARWQREEYRKILLDTLTSIEEDPSLLGMSAHLLAIGYKVC